MKKIVCFMVSSILATGAFANRIVAETSRDGKTLNKSVVATTTQMRTFVGGKYEKDSDADDGSTDIYGGWSNKKYTVEGDFLFTDGDDVLNVQGAMRINKKLALGVGINTAGDNAYEIGATYDLGKMLLGGSLTFDDDNDGLLIGVGSTKKGMSWEAGIDHGLDSDRTEIFAGMTKLMGTKELDGEIYYETDSSEFNVVADLEFLVKKAYYITPGLLYNNNGDADSSRFQLGADFGYRANKYDASVGVDFDLAGDDGNGKDYDSTVWNVNVAYQF